MQVKCRLDSPRVAIRGLLFFLPRLRLRLKTDAMDISSRWTGLSNPELDPTTVEGGEEGIAQHPSTLMRTRGDPEGISDEGWAVVRLDGKDWGKVLGIGRVGGRVIACKFCSHDT